MIAMVILQKYLPTKQKLKILLCVNTVVKEWFVYADTWSSVFIEL